MQALTDFAVEYFQQHQKQNAPLQLGAEWEMIGFHRAEKRRLNFAELESLLADFAQRYPVRPILEENKMIGLEFSAAPFAKATLTLEPGGQFEYSSAAGSFAELKKELTLYVEVLSGFAANKGYSFFSIGLDPISSVEQVPKLPKKRYSFMANYLPPLGASALDMMFKTGSFQISLDYRSEEDWRKKLIVSQFLAPFVVGLFSNANWTERKYKNLYSLRGEIWRTMDPQRVGFIPNSFRADFSYRDYAAYALGVPMLIIMRGSVPLDYTGRSFEDFWQGKYQDQPKPEDFAQHLRSIFTWTRAKSFLELRAADAHSLEVNLCQIVFWAALLYEPQNLTNLYESALDFGQDQTEALMAKVIRDGLQGDFQHQGFTKNLKELSLALLDILNLGIEEADFLTDREKVLYLRSFTQLFQAAMLAPENRQKDERSAVRLEFEAIYQELAQEAKVFG